jgi:hypothetical protein
MKDFKEFDAYFTKIKLEIYEKITDEPPGERASDYITKGFQYYLAFLEDKLTKAGRKPPTKVASSQ